MQDNLECLLNHFEIEGFVSNYWQKRPCIIKSFIPNFEDPIDEHELAGLAQESEVDSRIVSFHQGQWKAEFGPFEDFNEHCVGAWTLLVQGVDRYIESISELAGYVNFIPSWRFDDVMVSYSVKGAGVGAHIDQYDVFIVQGKGARRWQVGLPSDNLKEINKHPLLKLVEEFEPVIDYELQPGDAIYIPPKHPHKGETIEPGLNYSLGFRAPTDIELLHGLIDFGDETLRSVKRYSDPDIATLRADIYSPKRESRSAVCLGEIDRLKKDIANLLDSQSAEQALLAFISRQEIQNFEPENSFVYEDVERLLLEKVSIFKALGLRPIYSSHQATNTIQCAGKNNERTLFQFYIDGIKFECEGTLTKFIIPLMDSMSFDGYPSTLPKHLRLAFTNLVTELLNSGYWYVDVVNKP